MGGDLSLTRQCWLIALNTSMPLCKVCGRSAGFLSDCHPTCAAEAMRVEVERFRAHEKADWESGARQRIGAAVFVFDAVMAARGHDPTLVPLADVCWVYRRQVTQWSKLPPLPVIRTHEVVLHRAHADVLTVWNRLSFFGSREEVNQSIDELMKRAPWALFGYTNEARAAMAPERLGQTTRGIHARRASAGIGDAEVYVQGGTSAESLEAERINAFRPIVPVSRPRVPD